MSDFSRDDLENILKKLISKRSVEVNKIKGSMDNTQDLTSFLSDCQKKILHLERAIQHYQQFLREWTLYSTGERVEDDEPAKRTTWTIHNDIITIAIRRPNSKYATTIRFPALLAREILTFIFSFIEENKVIKRSDILGEFEKEIIQQTTYNSNSSGQVIYALILVLLKEGVLQASKNNKREYILKEKKEIFL
ncbi:hypothetical protein PRVXH_001290 [Proteinivorax hydrogeniformans]|uniref:Uncharacterized protein n=1 Tax=Proteinivorax hydrogeniformans TaxID=1826727 RepID=A0AAU8HX27_9FIRM